MEHFQDPEQEDTERPLPEDLLVQPLVEQHPLLEVEQHPLSEVEPQVSELKHPELVDMEVALRELVDMAAEQVVLEHSEEELEVSW